MAKKPPESSASHTASLGFEAKLIRGEGDYADANPEDPDEYNAENVFWVPAESRWSHLQAAARQPTVGKIVDDAMIAIERDNPRLKGVLPKDYTRPGRVAPTKANQDKQASGWQRPRYASLSRALGVT